MPSPPIYFHLPLSHLLPFTSLSVPYLSPVCNVHFISIPEILLRGSILSPLLLSLYLSTMYPSIHSLHLSIHPFLTHSYGIFCLSSQRVALVFTSLMSSRLVRCLAICWYWPQTHIFPLMSQLFTRKQFLFEYSAFQLIYPYSFSIGGIRQTKTNIIWSQLYVEFF